MEPKLRFREFSGDWEEKKLGDIAERINRKNKLNETSLSLTISAQYGLVDQETYFNKKISSHDISGYYLLRRGEFAYNKSYSNDYPFGAIKRLNNYNNGAVSTLYICFSLNKGINSDFIQQYFESDKWYREIYMIAFEGARNHGLLNIAVGDFFNTKHKFPSLPEQTKIADFLSTVDEKIQNQQDKITHLENIKKGFMQKIFSRKIRFKDANGNEFLEWEEKKLGETGIFYNGLSGKTKDDFDIGKEKFITYMNVFKNTIADKNMLQSVDIKEDEKQNIVEYGDVLFTQSSETIEEVGFSSVWLGDNKYYLNSFCFGFRFKKEYKINPVFMGYLFRSNSIREKIKKEGQGSTRFNLSSNRLGKIKIEVPCLEEQQKIADFLSSFDEKIDVEKEILDHLKELKKGLLQQMFV